ncbi:hypothetical protein C0J52_18353 [Blattella germanica]|nr:hypothetical protein C0J52_18353 [Blattella germanica]
MKAPYISKNWSNDNGRKWPTGHHSSWLQSSVDLACVFTRDLKLEQREWMEGANTPFFMVAEQRRSGNVFSHIAT